MIVAFIDASMTQPGRLPLSVPPCAMRWNWSRYERNWSQWSRRRCCQRMSRCGYVHLNQMENARSPGRAILPLHERGKNRMRFPSRSSKAGTLNVGKSLFGFARQFSCYARVLTVCKKLWHTRRRRPPQARTRPPGTLRLPGCPYRMCFSLQTKTPHRCRIQKSLLKGPHQRRSEVEPTRVRWIALVGGTSGLLARSAA